MTTTEQALKLAREALEHDVPGSCWSSGPLTGNPFEDLIVCPGCRAIAAIDAAEAIGDSVPIPKNEHQARLMVILGYNWMSLHAPSLLKE